MRTLLDALNPAIRSLKQYIEPLSSSTQLSFGEVLKKVAEASREGAMGTSLIASSAGRSNYISLDQMRGTPDPGAYAVSLVFQTIAELYSIE
jgi:hypothetical protein